jgi:pimeloyl-ACP methyl ester carboxylesterase
MRETRPAHSVERDFFVRAYGTAGKAPALVWIHGLGESGLCFEKIVGHPSLNSLRHLVPDLPGYGRSAWPENPMSLDAVADHLALWLSERGEPPVVLVGHSLGGTLGQILAESHPKLLAAFVNVEGNISGDDCTVSAQAAAQPLDAFVSDGFQRIVDSVYRAGASDLALRGAYASLRLCDPRTFHRHARELVRVSREETLAPRLARLMMPALFVAGQPGGAAKRSLDLLAKARARTVVISPSGHWPFMDQPDLFADALRGFLDRAGSGAGP